MTCLLDTHVMMWLLDDSSRLGGATRGWLEKQSDVFVSAASLWEVAIKSSLGRLRVPDDLPALIEASGLSWLPISPHHAWSVGLITGLPHRDPFDRLLCTQALLESLTLVTADRALLSAELEPAIRLHDAT